MLVYLSIYACEIRLLSYKLIIQKPITRSKVRKKKKKEEEHMSSTQSTLLHLILTITTIQSLAKITQQNKSLCKIYFNLPFHRPFL